MGIACWRLLTRTTICFELRTEDTVSHRHESLVSSDNITGSQTGAALFKLIRPYLCGSSFSLLLFLPHSAFRSEWSTLHNPIFTRSSCHLLIRIHHHLERRTCGSTAHSPICSRVEATTTNHQGLRDTVLVHQDLSYLSPDRPQRLPCETILQ